MIYTELHKVDPRLVPILRLSMPLDEFWSEITSETVFSRISFLEGCRSSVRSQPLRRRVPFLIGTCPGLYTRSFHTAVLPTVILAGRAVAIYIAL